jgi:hypothetical protein
VSGISVTNLNGQPPPARAQTAHESTVNGFGRHRPPATAPRRRIGDKVSTRDDEDAEPRPTRTLLLIDDVRLRRECLFHLLSAELPDFDVLAFATTQPPETWAAASVDIVLVSAASRRRGVRIQAPRDSECGAETARRRVWRRKGSSQSHRI